MSCNFSTDGIYKHIKTTAFKQKLLAIVLEGEKNEF
jgi:hypothetical protein